MTGRGNLCEHGRAERSHKTGHCLICQRENNRKYVKNNKEKVLEGKKRYRDTHSSPPRTEYMREWRLKNSEHINEYRRNYKGVRLDRTEYMREWRINNKEKLRVYFAEYRKSNVGKCNAWSKQKKLRKSQRCPAWADMQVIRDIYVKCAKIQEETGIPHHVDHVIPLSGKYISGLHVPENLQILTASENCSKSNKWPGDK